MQITLCRQQEPTGMKVPSYSRWVRSCVWETILPNVLPLSVNKETKFIAQMSSLCWISSCRSSLSTDAPSSSETSAEASVFAVVIHVLRTDLLLVSTCYRVHMHVIQRIPLKTSDLFTAPPFFPWRFLLGLQIVFSGKCIYRAKLLPGLWIG